MKAMLFVCLVLGATLCGCASGPRPLLRGELFLCLRQKLLLGLELLLQDFALPSLGAGTLGGGAPCCPDVAVEASNRAVATPNVARATAAGRTTARRVGTVVLDSMIVTGGYRWNRRSRRVTAIIRHARHPRKTPHCAASAATHDPARRSYPLVHPPICCN